MTRTLGLRAAPRRCKKSRTSSGARGRAVTDITIEDVARTFGDVRAVDGISQKISDGEFFTLLGPSGCGKSTLLRMVAGFCELDRGRILFGDERIDILPAHRPNT